MSILVFGLGTTGQVSSVFGKEVEVNIETVDDTEVILNDIVNIDVDTVTEPVVEVIENIEVELEEQELNVDKSCPPD